MLNYAEEPELASGSFLLDRDLPNAPSDEVPPNRDFHVVRTMDLITSPPVTDNTDVKDGHCRSQEPWHTNISEPAVLPYLLSP
jgi:hypothetical protein